MPGLLLHCGSQAATLERIATVPTPEPTATHFPIPHSALLREVRGQLEQGGVAIQEEAYGLSEDGMRLFGTLALKADRLPAARGSDLVLGLRNSHDKTFCAGLALGNRVFVCDNLSFYGTRTLARKHTRFCERDLPGLVARILGQLGDWARRQMDMIQSYEARRFSHLEAHDFMIQAIRARIVAPSRIAQVIDLWHREDRARNLWSLFNCFTEALRGTVEVSDLARRTEKLHGLADMRIAGKGENGALPERPIRGLLPSPAQVSAN